MDKIIFTEEFSNMLGPIYLIAYNFKEDKMFSAWAHVELINRDNGTFALQQPVSAGRQ